MRAMLLTDIQNDFCPGGALPVEDGDRIVPIVNALQRKFEWIAATKDWHPARHMSFASSHGRKPGEKAVVGGVEQVLWPDHCIQGTKGADYVKGLDVSRVKKVIYKGTDKEIDSYSGFFDNARKKATGLDEALKKKGVTQLYVTGLATDYCVKYTALDGASLGFEVFVIEDACMGIELNPGDIKQALLEMKNAGVKVLYAKDVS